MSLMWSFYSFNWEKWVAIFGGGLPDAEKHVLVAATWDQDAWDDVAVPERIARKIVKDGFSYEGLSEDECCVLDNMVVGFFCPEGLEELLAFEYESEEGIHPSLIEELIERAGAGSKPGLLKRLFGKRESTQEHPLVELEVLPAFLRGRRLNGSGVPRKVYEAYCILTPAEVARARQEVVTLMALPKPWTHSGLESAVRDYFLTALESVESKGMWLAARCC